jgi:hypothetical protein
MNNFNWMLRICLLPVLLIGGLPLFLYQLVNAEIPPIESEFSWANIFQAAAKKPPIPPKKGGRRPTDDVCMISPNASDETRIVWSDRPLFIWKGKVNTIAIRRKGSTTYLWSQNITGVESTTYTGRPLAPGQSYEWVVNDNTFVPFQVMKAQPRKQIAEKLTSLEKQQLAQGASPETIALAKANYFAQTELWSDALQETFSVPKPSANLVKIRQDLVVELCK